MPQKAITLIAFITNSLWFKTAYGITFTTQTALMVQESFATNDNFLNIFLNNTPAKVLYIFSIVWVLFKIVDAGCNTWKKWKINQLEIKMKQEDLESKEIENDIHRKDLNK
ncbi:hypothetical protein ACFQ5N_02160 [Lutibacter holmesii]|uniref:Uncharacterized protein n=1 Tax=Lutibacter holmesii TaxID=1137985 RepID=A0ABW3WLS4_9FLAO